MARVTLTREALDRAIEAHAASNAMDAAAAYAARGRRLERWTDAALVETYTSAMRRWALAGARPGRQWSDAICEMDLRGLSAPKNDLGDAEQAWKDRVMSIVREIAPVLEETAKEVLGYVYPALDPSIEPEDVEVRFGPEHL